MRHTAFGTSQGREEVSSPASPHRHAPRDLVPAVILCVPGRREEGLETQTSSTAAARRSSPQPTSLPPAARSPKHLPGATPGDRGCEPSLQPGADPSQQTPQPGQAPGRLRGRTWGCRWVGAALLGLLLLPRPPSQNRLQRFGWHHRQALDKRSAEGKILLINRKSRASRPAQGGRVGINLLEGRKQLLHYSSWYFLSNYTVSV